MNLLSRIPPLVQLLIAATTIVVVWCIVLPASMQIGAIREHIDFLDERQVDASAMYYTELNPSFLIDGLERDSD